jgi:protein-arginine kinase activator protein McsA
MICNHCASKTKEVEFKQVKPRAGMTKYICEVCKCEIVVTCTKDTNMTIKERITE